MGRYDVDGMLDSAPRQQLEEWAAYHAINPWGDDWERSSLVAARTINSLHGIAAGFGGKELDDSELIADDAFVPKLRKKKKAKQATPATAFAKMRQTIGV